MKVSLCALCIDFIVYELYLYAMKAFKNLKWGINGFYTVQTSKSFTSSPLEGTINTNASAFSNKFNMSMCLNTIRFGIYDSLCLNFIGIRSDQKKKFNENIEIDTNDIFPSANKNYQFFIIKKCIDYIVI